MKRKPPFTPEEMRKLLREFIDHFGHLDELPKIRGALEVIASLLQEMTLKL